MSSHDTVQKRISIISYDLWIIKKTKNRYTSLDSEIFYLIEFQFMA